MFRNWNWIYSFIFLGIFALIKSTTGVVDRTKICDPVEFYKPYVHIFKQRGGNPIFKLESAGFVDLRNQYGVLLCVNGPAYLHTEVEDRHNLTTEIRDITEFKANKTNLEVPFYMHECFMINRPNKTTDAHATDMDTTGMDVEALRKFHRAHAYPKELLTQDTEILGKKVYGIALLGKGGDYREPSMFMFLQKEFGYNDKGLVIETSFVTIGTSEWKGYDEFTNTSFTIVGDQQNGAFCSRPEGTDSLDKVFQRGHKRNDYMVTEIPKPKGSPPPPPPPPGVGQAPVDPPRDPANSTFKTGRLIDPLFFGASFLQSSNPPSPKIMHDGSAVLPQNSGPSQPEQIRYPFDFPEDVDPALEKPHRDAAISITGPRCKELPKQAEECTKLTPATGGCEVLKTVLELTPTDWTATGPNKDLAWKKDVIKLLEEIFMSICPNVNSKAVQSVGSVFVETHIIKAHTGTDPAPPPKEKRPEWDNLILELQHCKNGSSAMVFKEARGPPDGTNNEAPVLPMVYIDPLSLPNDTQIKPLPVPTVQPEFTRGNRRNLLVKRYDGSDAPIFYYEEAAEADYEFDTAIDFQWKIFSTVIGYCNKFYTLKKSGVFPKLMAEFNKDFMAMNEKLWIEPKLNHIYAYIMGNSGAWLDECLEGAYVHSDSEEFRPVRMVNINGGQHPNHFTKIPPHK